MNPADEPKTNQTNPNPIIGAQHTPGGQSREAGKSGGGLHEGAPVEMVGRGCSIGERGIHACHIRATLKANVKNNSRQTSAAKVMERRGTDKNGEFSGAGFIEVKNYSDLVRFSDVRFAE